MPELLAWTEAGSGVPVLLIHGDFSNGRGAWGRQLVSLADRARLVAVDRMGHGNSPSVAGPISIADEAEDALAVLDALGIERATVVGHSYGGLIAMELAARHPDRVRSLHLIEPPYLGLLQEDPEVARLDRQVKAIVAGPDRDDPEAMADQFFRIIAGPEEHAALRASTAWPGIVREGKRFAEGEPAGDYPPERLDRVKPDIQTTLYRGGRSHPALGRLAEEIVRRRPGARLVTVGEAGHAVQRTGTAFESELLRELGAATKAG